MGATAFRARAQAAEEFAVVPWPETKPAEWLSERLSSGEVGYDPWLHTAGDAKALREGLRDGLGLRPSPNLVDAIWDERPAPPEAPFAPYPPELAGETAAEKRARIAAVLREAGEKAAVLTLPASIAWLLNIRGADVTRTPAPHAFAILHEDARADLFARPGKADAVAEHLGTEVTTLSDEAFPAALVNLSGPVRVDPASAPDAVMRLLLDAGVEVSRAPDPCLLPKATKNAAEIAGAREAHERDGAAMARFLAWLEGRIASGAPGDLTEIAVVRALEGFRRRSNSLRDISFDTIAGSGPHGAIVHYRVTEATDRPPRAGRDAAGRFGRAISRRDHGRDAHAGRGRGAARGARDLHLRAARHDRAVAHALPARASRAPISTRWRDSTCGARGRTTTTAPATAWVTTSASTRGRRGSRAAP